MDHYEELVYEKTLSPKKNKGTINWERILNVHVKRIFLSIIGFVISHVSIYQMNPMAIAYYAVLYLDKPSRVWIFISTVLALGTTVSVMDFIKYMLIILLIITLNTYREVRGSKISLISVAVVATLSTLTISYAFVYMQGNGSYWISLAVLESVIVFALVFIYSKSITYILRQDRHLQLSNEQLISFGVLMASVIAGATGLSFLDLSIKDTLLYTSILYFSYRFGMGIGAVVGLMSGLVLTVMGMFNPILFGVFGIMGILSGLFREIGKIGSSTGLVLGTFLFGYYYAPELLEFNMMKALISSVVIFTLMPRQWLIRADGESEKVIVTNDYYKEKIQKLTKEKLKSFADSFNKLAETFSSISEKKTSLTQQEVNQLFDEVAEKVCSNCSMCALCWQKEFYDTYKAAFSILGAAEKKGKIQKSDVPREFVDKCIKLDEFVITTNRIFELFKINLSWHNRIVESRELVSEQLTGVAHIIENFSDELYSNLEIEKKLEKNIELELKKFQLSIDELMVIEKQNKRKEVYLTVKSLQRDAILSKELTPAISKAMNKRMKLEEGSKYTIDQEYSTIRFVEEKIFRTMQGVARAIKEGEKYSGDNFSFLDLPNGQTILALSDGMGTGLQACKESEAAIDLLEQFMETGFDKQTAIKMINSVLVLKSNEHSFSTLDMSVLDLYTGVCEFVKIGAASTFIKRNDSVEIIKSTSLPVGVLNKVDFETTTRKLYEGDFIIMVTDGILDSDDERIEKEQWIEEALMEIKSKNPQEIADYILDKAKEKVHHKIQDDMTVLVSRIWKK